MSSATWPLSLSLALFTLAVGIIRAFGVVMTRTAARVAERTGLGEAIMGALFVGASTSLPEIATSTTAAVSGHAELHATLKLLLISVVLLPILPNQGYGPDQAFNPYEVWWMVVLIACISFIGYFTTKVAGPHKGAVVTSLFAGLASSTALTLHFSRSRPRATAPTPISSLRGSFSPTGPCSPAF
jgi:hypothetical protein